MVFQANSKQWGLSPEGTLGVCPHRNAEITWAWAWCPWHKQRHCLQRKGSRWETRTGHNSLALETRECLFLLSRVFVDAKGISWETRTGFSHSADISSTKYMMWKRKHVKRKRSLQKSKIKLTANLKNKRNSEDSGMTSSKSWDRIKYVE